MGGVSAAGTARFSVPDVGNPTTMRKRITMSTSTFPVSLPGAVAPIRMWADPTDVEPAALAQLRNIAALPWVQGVAVMPDVHLGKGATVGSVVAMRSAVSPAAVGVDIGCGMTAVQTSLTTDDLPDSLRSLRSAIEAAIPVGFRAHRDPAAPLTGSGTQAAAADALFDRFDALDGGVHRLRQKATLQVGTLGGGNHFIEVTSDEHEHDEAVQSFVFRSNKAFDPVKLEDFLGGLIQVYGPDMLRYKGVLFMKGSDRQTVFQGVHQMMGADVGRKWQSGEKPSSKMVFIGRNLPKDMFIKGLEQCLA
jgi:hypothetical protein